MANYSTQFDPAAPVALVSFVNLDSARRIDDVLMLLDTGADITLVPQTVADFLEADLTPTTYEIEYLEQVGSSPPAVRLQMVWLERNFTGEYLVTPTAYGILGRNILNHIRLVLDGPRLNWEVQQTSPV